MNEAGQAAKSRDVSPVDIVLVYRARYRPDSSRFETSAVIGIVCEGSESLVSHCRNIFPSRYTVSLKHSGCELPGSLPSSRDISDLPAYVPEFLHEFSLEKAL